MGYVLKLTRKIPTLYFIDHLNHIMWEIHAEKVFKYYIVFNIFKCRLSGKLILIQYQ